MFCVMIQKLASNSKESQTESQTKSQTESQTGHVSAKCCNPDPRSMTLNTNITS